MGKDLSKTVTVIVQNEKIPRENGEATNLLLTLLGDYETLRKLLLIIYQFEIIF